jgi:hypothetical protein
MAYYTIDKETFSYFFGSYKTCYGDIEITGGSIDRIEELLGDL